MPKNVLKLNLFLDPAKPKLCKYISEQNENEELLYLLLKLWGLSGYFKSRYLIYKLRYYFFKPLFEIRCSLNETNIRFIVRDMS